MALPIESMYGMFTYIHLKNQPNVVEYTIHGSYGIYMGFTVFFFTPRNGVINLILITGRGHLEPIFTIKTLCDHKKQIHGLDDRSMRD